MTTNEISPQERLDKLVDSLELITARFLELTTANNQLASSQTPEIRKLFDGWLGLMSEEVLRIASKDGAADIDAASSQTGLAASSIVSLLREDPPIRLAHISTMATLYKIVSLITQRVPRSPWL